MRLTRFFLVLIPLIIFNTPGFTQSKKNVWHQGEIQLPDDQVYRVELRFISDRTEGLLQVKEQNQLLTLSPLKVKSFQFFDSLRNQQRKFVSLSVQMDDYQYKKNLFFEVLYNGESVSLLGRTDSFSISSFESLYLHNHKEDIILPFATSKWMKNKRPVYQKPDVKLLYEMAGERKNELKSFITSNKLQLNHPADMIALLTHFDHLSAATSKN